MGPSGTVGKDSPVPLAKSSASAGFGSAFFVAVIRNLAVPRASSQLADTLENFPRFAPVEPCWPQANPTLALVVRLSAAEEEVSLTFNRTIGSGRELQFGSHGETASRQESQDACARKTLSNSLTLAQVCCK
jgi:hypothetical protein